MSVSPRCKTLDINTLPVVNNNGNIESPQPLNHVLHNVHRLTYGRDQEKAYVDYQADPHLYNSGKKLTVAYRRNKDDPDALENRLLNCKNQSAKQNAILKSLREILPSISHLYSTVTRITLETVNGNLSQIVTEDVEEIIHYLPIPIQFSHIPTVPVTNLRKVIDLSMDVDRVNWNGETWAFKLTGPNLEGTLREIFVLDQLSDAPYIIKLKAIVTNVDNTIRGFITPYSHHGDLANVFHVEHTNRDLVDDGDTIAFDWPLKLSWARQITRGVVELHAILAFNGDLKLRNVLLNAAGQAVLIDFCPLGFTDEYAAPEIFAKLDDHDTAIESLFTAAADIFSLGLMLYAVAEEKSRIVRPLVWREGKTPDWYRGIVQRCLVKEPEDRPSAVELLRSLDEGRY